MGSLKNKLRRKQAKQANKTAGNAAGRDAEALVHKQKLKAYLEAGQYEEIINYVAGIVNIVAMDAEMMSFVAKAYYGMGDYARSKQWANMAMAKVQKVGKDQAKAAHVRRKKLVFLPYKASMWDSMESVWQAASRDSDRCEVYVAAIPYCDRKKDMSAGEWHCERDLFPEHVNVRDWHDFTYEKLKEMRPDAIFIHNPYDNCNIVTSVDGQFYSDKLKECTGRLVYIPYYSTTGGMADSQAMCPAYVNADDIIIQAEALREYFDASVHGKIQPLGSPKFDKIISLCKNPPVPPAAWQVRMAGKKVYFYNTSLGGMLQDTPGFLRKMRYVFQQFANCPDVCLIWRPHPLMMATLQSMRPAYVAEYEALKQEFLDRQIGIYDDTPIMENTIAMCDCYIGDAGTSVTSIFGVAGKPMFILNNKIDRVPEDGDRYRKLFSGFCCMQNRDWMITWNNVLLHAPEHDGRFAYYCRLNDYASGGYYGQVAEIGDRIYVCPVKADDFLVLKDGKIVKRIPLKPYDSDGKALFWGGTNFWLHPGWKDKIIMMPMHYPYLVCLDVRDDSVTYHEIPQAATIREIDEEWYQGIRFFWRGMFIIGGVSDCRLFIFDEELNLQQTVDINPGGRGFIGAFTEELDGDEIWFLPRDGFIILCWNAVTGEIREYTGFPNGFVCTHPVHEYKCSLRPLMGPMMTKDKFYFPPMWGNMFICLDKRTGDFAEVQLPFAVDTDGKDCYNPHCLTGWFFRYDWNERWQFIHYRERKLYWVDETEDSGLIFTEQENQVEFAEELLDVLPEGFTEISEQLRYGCREDVFNSLPGLLAGRIKGCQHDAARQKKAYGAVAANNDGTAGKKIYDYVMSKI